MLPKIGPKVVGKTPSSLKTKTVRAVNLIKNGPKVALYGGAGSCVVGSFFSAVTGAVIPLALFTLGGLGLIKLSEALTNACKNIEKRYPNIANTVGLSKKNGMNVNA